MKKLSKIGGEIALHNDEKTFYITIDNDTKLTENKGGNICLYEDEKTYTRDDELPYTEYPVSIGTSSYLSLNQAVAICGNACTIDANKGIKIYDSVVISKDQNITIQIGYLIIHGIPSLFSVNGELTIQSVESGYYGSLSWNKGPCITNNKDGKLNHKYVMMDHCNYENSNTSNSTLYGACINSFGTVVVDNGYFRYNENTVIGTVAVSGGTGKFTSTSFSQNKATIGASALLCMTECEMEDCCIDKNITNGTGNVLYGAVVAKNYLDSSVKPALVIKDLQFNENEIKETGEKGYGAAIYGDNCDISITSESSYSNYFSNNKNYIGDGGAIYIENGNEVAISGITFRENTATDRAGAVYVAANSISLTSCTLTKNVSPNGGAMMLKLVGNAQPQLSGDMPFTGNIPKDYCIFDNDSELFNCKNYNE